MRTFSVHVYNLVSLAEPYWSSSTINIIFILVPFSLESVSNRWPSFIHPVLQNFTPYYKDYIISMSRYIVSLNLKEVNEIFRRAIIRAYFEPELLKRDYRKSNVKHPLILDDGLTVEDVLHLYFDISTGIDYPDGDEWFTVEYLLPFNVKLPDNLKGLDYFTTLSVSDGKHFWRHRELIRFKMGKSKRLAESLEFIDKKYKELSKAVHDSPVINQIK